MRALNASGLQAKATKKERVTLFQFDLDHSSLFIKRNFPPQLILLYTIIYHQGIFMMAVVVGFLTAFPRLPFSKPQRLSEEAIPFI